MWQRFTERARRVVFFAQEEAGRLGENYVSTEHILLGLVRENDCVAARILDNMGVSTSRIRSEIERQVMRSEGRIGQDMQLTPRAKQVIDLAYDEAKQLNNNYIGTEHLLLGAIREGEGLAGRVLAKLGVELERVREEVQKLQDANTTVSQQINAARMREQNGLIERLINAFTSKGDKGEAAKEAIQALAEQMKMPSEPAPSSSPAIGIGDLGILQNPDGGTRVIAALDEETLTALTTIVAAKDVYGYRELAQGGKTIELAIGTQAKYLGGSGSENGHLRLLDGEQAGLVVWLPFRFFQRTGPDDAPFPPEP